MKIRKILRPILVGVLLLGVLVTLGFLSFTGMLVFTPFLPAAIGSFLFAVLYEGEVYRQNLLAGLKKIFTKNALKKKIVERELKELIKNEAALQNSQFLKDYKSQLYYIKELQAHSSDKKLLKREEERLRLMRLYFSRYLFATESIRGDGLTIELNNIITNKKKKELKLELISKSSINRVLVAVYGFAGVSCALASTYAIHSGFLVLAVSFGISIAPAILMGGIIPLAIIAGIGYSILVYHNISDMLANNAIKKFINKMKSHFIQQGQSKFSYVLKVIGLGLLLTAVIGIVVFVTVATAGTWWIAAKKCVALLPPIANIVSWVKSIAIGPMFFSTLLFNLKNSFSTLKKMGQFSITQKFRETLAELKNAWQKESWIEFVNPFRFLIHVVSTPFKFISFLMHLVSVCVMGDQLSGVPPIITSTCNFANEALVDAHYFMDDHSHRGHCHEHGTIVTSFLKATLSPLMLLSAFWAWGFSGDNKSFLQHIKNTFGLHPHKEVGPRVISDAWKHREIIMKLEKKVKHYENEQESLFSDFEVSRQKQEVMQSIKDRLETAAIKVPESLQKPSVNLVEAIKEELKSSREENSVTGEKIITQNRNWFWKKKAPASKLFIDEILQRDDYQSIRI